MLVVLDSLDLSNAERKLVSEALGVSGSIAEAAALLGITRHALKRRMLKHQIAWPSASRSAMDSRNDGAARLSAMEQHHPMMPSHGPLPGPGTSNLPPQPANMQPLGFGPLPHHLQGQPPLAHLHPGVGPAVVPQVAGQPAGGAKPSTAPFGAARLVPPGTKRGH